MTASPWSRKLKDDEVIGDFDRYNTSDKGYIPQRHLFHIDHPETYPEAVEDLVICLQCPFFHTNHWVIRKWMGDGFSLLSMDREYIVIAWMRIPPAPMHFSKYISNGK